KAGIIHNTIGKVNFTSYALKQILEQLLTDLKKAKPSVSKGIYLKKVSVSSTMGPGINVDF
ncbi:50S ribosomal protein L1, partial [Francisella tularensis subsp. holarctica]|nr:50S ribosomal protein L1 [Francisella tularensis subsp. holarctica]